MDSTLLIGVENNLYKQLTIIVTGSIMSQVDPPPLEFSI